jgi:hypothetical protein
MTESPFDEIFPTPEVYVERIAAKSPRTKTTLPNEYDIARLSGLNLHPSAGKP